MSTLRSVVSRIERVSASRFAICTIAIYIALSLAAYFPEWPGDPHRLPPCACGDTVQAVWFLEWAAWALVHGHNLFFTTRMFYPSGANLAINTETPLLGLVTAPLSILVSPVASFNLLMWASFPLSATAMFVALRRWTHSNLASAVGGLLYGFSAYVVGEGLGHLNLTFVPLPPLILLALFELAVAQKGNARRWGVLLGLLAAAQFLISPEILSTTAIVGLCGVVILAVAYRRSIERLRIRYILTGALPAVVLFAVLVGYPAYYMITGPLRIQGPIQGYGNPYYADLLGVVVPTSNQRFAPTAAIALGDRFAGGIPAENGSYLGIPLLLLTIWCCVHFRRNRWILFSAAMAAVAFVLSLGPRLAIDTHVTAVRLPFDLISRIPLIYNILPSRISLYVVMFVSLILALATSELTRRTTGPIATTDSVQPHWTGTARVLAVAVLIVASAVSLVPRWPIPTAGIADGVPPFFESSAVDTLPFNGIVLTYPFAVSPANQAMLWQAIDHLRFTLIGGYALEPNSNGGASPWPPDLEPYEVQEFLGYEELGPTGYLVTKAPAVNLRFVRNVRRYVLRYGIGTVVLDQSAENAPTVEAVIAQALGKPTESEGGVDLWLHATSLAATTRG